MALSARFGEALLLAHELHGEQLRKGSDVPYLAHLLAVAAIALEHGASEDEAIAALLHDAIEDQGGAATAAEIERRFGPDVLAIVQGCTDTDQTPKPPWRARKEAYLARLPAETHSTRLICAADKLHNVRSLLDDYQRLGEQLWSLFSGCRAGTLWYYRSVADSLHASDDRPLTRQLLQAVAELERLAAAADPGEENLAR